MVSVYGLFVLAVVWRLFILLWVALRLQPQHIATWAVREPRLLNVHRRRVNVGLLLAALGLLGMVAMFMRLSASQIQAQPQWLGLVILMPALALCALMEVWDYGRYRLLVYKNYGDFYRDWDYYARDDSVLTRIIIALYGLMALVVLLLCVLEAATLW